VLPGPLLSLKETIYDYAIKPYAEPSREQLLPDVPSQIRGKERPTLVISLDGTLIESTWTRQYGWRYVKRPGVDQFLAQLAPHFELVMWTDSMNTADPVVERLDPRRFFRHRLYRDATTYSGGQHIKDLSALNRNVAKCLIIDCDAACFGLHPAHGIAVPPYVSTADPDKSDRTLTRLVPLLIYLKRALELGKITSVTDELAAVRALGNGDAAAGFEVRLVELKAAGKLSLASGGAGGVRPSGPTLWDRLRGPK